MNAPITYQPSPVTDEDLERELRIDAFREVMTRATTPSRKRLAQSQMVAEIHNRTPAAVAWLEAQRGLSAADVPHRPVPASVFRRSA
jgi:hypothetical protein